MPALAALNPYTDSAVVSSENFPSSAPLPVSCEQPAIPSASTSAKAKSTAVKIFFISFFLLSFYPGRGAPELPFLTYTTAQSARFVGSPRNFLKFFRALPPRPLFDIA